MNLRNLLLIKDGEVFKITTLNVFEKRVFQIGVNNMTRTFFTQID